MPVYLEMSGNLRYVNGCQCFITLTEQGIACLDSSGILCGCFDRKYDGFSVMSLHTYQGLFEKIQLCLEGGEEIAKYGPCH